MSTQVDEDKIIDRLFVLKVCLHIRSSQDLAVKRLASGLAHPADFEKSKVIRRICKRLRGNDEAIRNMSSNGALKLHHPEVKRLRGNRSAPMLRVWHPKLGSLKGVDLVMDRELWILDYLLGFQTFSPVVVNPHFVRRSGRLVTPKSGRMLCELELMCDSDAVLLSPGCVCALCVVR